MLSLQIGTKKITTERPSFVMGICNATSDSFYKKSRGGIKKAFELGKTVESSVKGGYKKTMMSVIDIYAVAALGAVALLIGIAGVYTFALQALICIVTAAFCNLLWGRGINHVFLSAWYMA